MFAFQDSKLSPEREVFQHQAAAVAKDAKYGPEPQPKKVEHGGQVIADRIVGCIPMLLISRPDRIVTRHRTRTAMKNQKTRADELIRSKYFEEEGILLKDVLEELEQQIKMVQNMMDAYDLVATKAGQPERTTDSHTLRKIISEAWLGPTRFPSPSPLVNCQPGPVGLSFCRLHPRDPGEVRHGSVEFSINDVTTR